MWWTSGENNLNFLYRRYWSNSSIFWTSQEINKQGWLEFRAIGLENMFHIKGAATPCSSTLLLGRNGAMIVQSSNSLREARNQMLHKVFWFLNVGNWFNSVLVFVFFFFLKTLSKPIPGNSAERPWGQWVWGWWTNLHNHGEEQKGKTQLKMGHWEKSFLSSCKFVSTMLATVADVIYGHYPPEADSWACQASETAREECSMLGHQGLWIIWFQEMERWALTKRLKGDEMKALIRK